MNKIAKTIKESCSDDKVMCEFLLDLLELNLTGQQWYKDEYKKRISAYAERYENGGSKNED